MRIFHYLGPFSPWGPGTSGFISGLLLCLLFTLVLLWWRLK